MQTVKSVKYGATNWHEIEFQSWGEFLDCAENRPQSKYSTVVSSRSTDSGKMAKSWALGATFADAVKMGREGWPEGTKQAEGINATLVDKVTSLIERTQYFYDVTGMDFDIGAALTGQPEHWLNPETVSEQGTGTKFVKIVLNNCTSAAIDAEVMMRKGAAVAALTQLLETTGYRCEVELVCADEGYLWRVPVKAAEQPLDLDRMVYGLAHPATFRRLFFSLMEEHDDFMKSHNYGYGMPTDAPKERQGDIYIGKALYGESQWQSTETAQQWVIEQLKKQGVQIEA